MGVLLGGLSSLLYGVGDFLGGEGAKRVSAATVVLWAGLVSFPLILIVALLTGGDAQPSDLWLGAAGGSAGALGLVSLFAGLGRGQAAAVAPAAAAFGGIVPVGVAVLTGDPISTLTWVGVVVAIPAIVLCSWVGEPGDVPLGGVWYGLAAGLGFGVYTVLLDQTSEASALLPLIPARAATMLAISLIALLGVWRVSGFSSIPKAIILGNGLLDVSGNVTLLLALRLGSLAPVAVAASFYPAVTVLMARIVNAEHLRGRQILGLVLTLAALAVIAAG
ncbi:MAG TPA: DMT family transporter [Acidimicrobiia bacterium]|nr:DMT family transporter [Acidimicrobiia bacterium]